MPKLLNLSLICAFLLAGVATWVSPRLLAWYASPPVAIGVTCDPAMRWAMEKMMIGQVVGALAGALVGFILYLKFKKSPPSAPISQNPK